MAKKDQKFHIARIRDWISNRGSDYFFFILSLILAAYSGWALFFTGQVPIIGIRQPLYLFGMAAWAEFFASLSLSLYCLFLFVIDSEKPMSKKTTTILGYSTLVLWVAAILLAKYFNLHE